MEEKEIEELEREIFKYHDTPFQIRCNELIDEICREFDNFGFSNEYLKFYRGESNKEEVDQYINGKLMLIDEYKKHDFNEMASMLSQSNCGWHYYRVGRIVHEQLLRIWFPEGYK